MAAGDGAYLARLSLDAAALNPPFDGAITNYSVTVPYETNSVTVTPIAVKASAAITVNGSPVVSGSASGNIPVAVGSNTITVVFTAPGGSLTKTYFIFVNRLPSTNATLASLALGAATLFPDFLNSTTNYTANVPYESNSITVTPTAGQTNATITVNGISVISGAASAAIALNVGTNIIDVTVTAQNGTNRLTYTINITRLPSDNAFLSSLTLSAGTMNPAFNDATTNYTVFVPYATSTLTATPVAAQSNATIVINGTTVSSGSTSGPISLLAGANAITIVVTAQDGVTARTYSLTVQRSFLVTNTADSGAGSLRQALADAANNPGGDTIFFDPALSGQTITLTSGAITVNDTKGVTVDASLLPGGIVIDGNLNDRGIVIQTGALTLRALTITRAYTPPALGVAPY